jgi:hypothetical protein
MTAVVWHVTLAKVFGGDGLGLFGVPGGLRVGLEPTHVARMGQLTDLRSGVGSSERSDAEGSG